MAGQTSVSSSQRKPDGGKGKGLAVVEDEDMAVVSPQQLVTISNNKDSSTNQGEGSSKKEEEEGTIIITSGKATSSCSGKVSIQPIFGREEDEDQSSAHENRTRKRKYRTIADIYRVSKITFDS